MVERGMRTGRALVLHQITAMDVPPPEFARLAADAGCDQISVFTNCPDAVLPGQSAKLNFPAIAPQARREMLAELADCGVRINGVEYFPVLADLDVADYLPGLALGGELGAVRAVTHIHDTDSARAVDSVGRLCELAAAQGMTLGVEFTPMTRGCPSLERAAWFVDQVGRADFAIGLDCLHLIRSGATAQDAARLGPRYFANGQICDGHGLHRSNAYMDEAHNRELPGKGDFPIAAILDALPAGAPIEIEAPSAKYREAGVSARDHIRNAVACARAVLEVAETR
jgi:sugar phosphate isomerase/epimerase